MCWCRPAITPLFTFNSDVRDTMVACTYSMDAIYGFTKFLTNLSLSRTSLDCSGKYVCYLEPIHELTEMLEELSLPCHIDWYLQASVLLMLFQISAAEGLAHCIKWDRIIRQIVKIYTSQSQEHQTIFRYDIYFSGILTHQSAYSHLLFDPINSWNWYHCISPLLLCWLLSGGL